MNRAKALFLASLLAAPGGPQAATIRVDANHEGHAVAPTLWGVFFEDINLSADGGIYPELVRNRSFEDADTPVFWQVTGPTNGTVSIDANHPLNPLNRHCLRWQISGEAAVENEGYWGMPVVKDEHYTFRLAARAEGYMGSLSVRLIAASGQELAHGDTAAISGIWKYYALELAPAASDSKARLQISAAGHGTLFLDMVSLMPRKTWKEHGLRPDLAGALDSLRPSFVRFPGGCWVEGDDVAHMYNWKKTIGAPDLRTPLHNIWGYNATHGLGFHEYLQMSEDLGAAPLFCLNVGMSHHEIIPMDQMGQWVQDALDAVEYANGPVSSTWGAARARNGHPNPFGLKHLEIGNENGGAAYRERWPLFVKAIKTRYPEIQLVANQWEGGYPTNPPPDIVDEHYYSTPEFFMREAHHYDHYDRKGPRIFVGEYAVTQNCGQGNLRAAIGEAAFMTGLERNSDVVVMASYAPLFVNLNHRSWNPDLINFDGARWYGLPSYYVQQLFSQHRGDVTLPITVDSPSAEAPAPGGRIGVGTWNTQAEFKDIKVTAPDGQVLFASNFATNLDGWKRLGGGNWSVESGALRQSAEREFVRAVAGNPNWTDYTLELKARKIAGREGFLILFHIKDDEDRFWWNLGGWENTRHALELGEVVDGKSGAIELRKWYDIKISLNGRRIQCWLDGKLVHEIEQRSSRTESLYASATRDEQHGEIILKVVNTEVSPVTAEIRIDGARNLADTAQLTCLTSSSATDENSIDEPTKVFPRSETLKLAGASFSHGFPGNSLTILRIGAPKP